MREKRRKVPQKKRWEGNIEECNGRTLVAEDRIRRKGISVELRRSRKDVG